MIKPQLKEFMRRIEKDSVAIIPAAREAVRSHDTNYRYRQNSDFFYLTGFEEPEAIAVIAPSRDKKFTLFVRPRDLDQEIWYGYRAGVEGARFHVHTPLIAMSKAAIIRRGIELGLDYGLTHSCYDPSTSGQPCGRCDSCVLRARGFAEAGLSDPLLLR